jgi:hypothetical protein
VSPRQRTAIRAGLAVIVVTALAWLIVTTIRGRRPYSVDATTLSGWTLVAGEPGAPALVALQPPPALPSALFDQLSKRTRQSLMAPSRPSVPLVLQVEYEESLQGVWSVADIVRLARETNLETARFEPVCVGQHSESSAGETHRLFFVMFSAPAFDEFRQQLTPLFPEHGGAGVFDPVALRPVLTIAASDREFVIRWPLAVEQRQDCQASLRVN